MRLRWLRPAIEDWTAIMLYEARRNQDHARAVVLALENKLRLIQAHPEAMGPKLLHNPRIRGAPVTPGALTIFYVARRDEIEIRRIKPQRKKPLRPRIDF